MIWPWHRRHKRRAIDPAEMAERGAEQRALMAALNRTTEDEMANLDELKEWIEGADALALGLQMALKDIHGEPAQTGQIAALDAIVDALRTNLDRAESALDVELERMAGADAA
jgi:hypothetical protein